MRKILFIIPLFLWACGGSSPTKSELVSLPIVQNLSIEIEEDTSTQIVLPRTNNSTLGLTYSISTNAQNGTVSISSVQGRATYVPEANFFGSDSFTFSITNGETTSPIATVSINITPVNDAPVVEDITYTLSDSNEITLEGSDVDNDDLTYSIISNPLYGTASLNDNVVIYDGYPPSDYFTYTVSDGILESNLGNVYLTAGENAFDKRLIQFRYPSSGSSRVASGRQQAYDVTEGYDGTFVLAGLNIPTGGNPNGYFVHVDNNLNQIGEFFYYTGARDSYFNNVHPTNDGGYILAGIENIYSNSEYQYHALLVKVDSNGNEEWSSQFNDTGNLWSAHGVIQTNDGGYLLGIRGDGDSIIIIKTNSSGEEEWKKNVDYNNEYAEPRYIFETNDGGYIIGSYHSNNKMLITKLQSDGTQEWHNEDDSYGTFRNMKKSLSGGYVAIGIVNVGSLDYNFVKIDENGTIEYGYPIYPTIDPNEVSNIEINDVIEVNDGYVFTGSVLVDPSANTPDYDIYIFKTDFNFVRKWSLTYGDSDDETDYTAGRHLIYSSDGNFVTVGPSQTVPGGEGVSQMDIGFIRVDSDGNEID